MRQLALATLLLAMAPCLGVAQNSNDWSDIQRLIGPGDKIYITNSRGAKITGAVDSLSSTSLAIRAGHLRYELRPEEVKSIRRQKPDSLLNGAVIGGMIGAAFVVSTAISDYVYYEDGRPQPGPNYVVHPALGAGLGAALGLLIDAHHKGKKVVYSRPAEAKTTSLLRSLSFAPAIWKNQKGAALSFSF